MQLDRRGVLSGLFAGGLACALPKPSWAEAAHAAALSGDPPWYRFELPNGLRAHLLANGTGYVGGGLLLRAREITPENGGLAHIMEHTSFTGAAGELSAADVKNLHKDVIQDSNASTRLGAIEWQVSLLPDRLAEALHVLSLTSLDQKFDEETVASEAKVVLQELYLDKYGKAERAQKRFERALYGDDHPYARDTVEKEIATADKEPAKLAAELRRYAAGLRLPANMDLFLAGGLDVGAAETAIRKSFGAYPFAQAPTFDFPRVATTRAYKKLTGPAHDLSRPMCQLMLAWNTGVCIRDPDARVVLALREYLDSILFLYLREKHGETYTPQIEYQPDSCSGVFTITITSSEGVAKVERSVFEAVEQARKSVDPREVARLTNRAKLKRLKSASDNAALVKRGVEGTLDGASADDLPIDTATADEILNAARQYLPVHHGAYVRLALHGQ